MTSREALSRNRKRGLMDIRGSSPDQMEEAEIIRDHLLTQMERTIDELKTAEHPAWLDLSLSLRTIRLKSNTRWWKEREERHPKSVLNDHLPIGSLHKIPERTPWKKSKSRKKRETLTEETLIPWKSST